MKYIKKRSLESSKTPVL